MGMEMEGVIKDSLERLDYLEQQESCCASLKDQMKTLKIELKFLRTFFMSEELMIIDREEIKDRYKKIRAVVQQDVGEVILSLGGGEVPIDLDGSLISVQEKIELIKLEVHQCYHRIKRLWREGDIEGDLQVKFIDYVLENMKDLLIQSDQVNSIVGVKKLINTLERRLRFLRNSLLFVAKLELRKWALYSLKVEVGYAATTAASFFFRCWINKMDGNSDLSRALHYKANGEDTSLYDGICRASKALTSDAPFSLLVGFIDFLLDQLAELLSRDGSVEIPTRDYFESLREDLKLVRSFLTTKTATDPHTDHVKSHRQHIGSELNKVARLIEDWHVRDMDEEMMSMDNTILLPSLGRRKLISLLCMEDLVNDESSSTAPMKDQLETLRKDIRLLRTFYVETQNGDHVHQEIKDILSLMDVMALEAGSAIYSFQDNEDKEGMAEEMSNLLPDLLDKIKLIKADMRKIYSRATSSNFRETRGLRGTTHSLKDLSELLNSRFAIISRFVKPHIEKAAKLWIENLQNELHFLISLLDNSEEQCIEIGEQEALEIHIRNMENEARYATEPISLRDDPVWYRMLKFSTVLEEVELIKKEIKRINQKISGEKLSAMREVIVGFEDEAKSIIEQLIGGPEQLNIVSIIGMGGLGKTTLVKKLYSNPSVVEYFDVRAWCCVSQLFEKRQVLHDILSHVDERSKDIHVGSDEDLAKQLYQSLKGRRYLIVIDDIWDIEAWNAIRRCFCDDKKGSRIVFTTRLEEIASKVQASSGICHHLCYFTDDESWDLLQKKLFLGKRCPTEQSETVNKIAKNCKGLPLAVVLMAGVLARKKEEEWEQVAESLSRHTDGDLQNLSKEVLELSYKNLPDHLRPCFLYLGAFPEDKEILGKKVIWLWAAEGFIQTTEQKSSEDIAKDNLMDLIGRSLVIVAERGSSGGVKTFRVHDLLLNFSLAKAKEEKFLLLLDGNDEPFAPTNLKFHQQVDGNVESCNSNSTTYGQYRLCIYSMLNDIEKLSSSLHVSSLLHFAPFHLDDASFIFSNFKLLNVLDLGRLLLKDLNCGIELLVQLRLFVVRIRSRSIPSSIANLKNLETFLVKGIRGEVDIPDTVWSMESLRHLHIDKRASSIWDKRDIKDAILDKLETLSTPTLPYGTNSRDVMCSLPNLRKLKCIFTAFWSNFENCNYFPELDSLSQLESLKVFYYATKVSHGILSFPSNLKKLTISNFRLPWSDIATIATLPNLEVLKLLLKAFDGEKWETRDDEFLKLKYLKLEALNIEEWNVSSEDHFPVLEKLVVHRCKQLQEISSSFGNINTLEMIEVKWCNHSVANSAKDIYQEQQEFGNEVLKVIIHPYPSDQGLTSSSS